MKVRPLAFLSWMQTASEIVQSLLDLRPKSRRRPTSSGKTQMGYFAPVSRLVHHGPNVME